ncbi:MAG: hypothetical protein QOJ14_963 [Thermoleophilaceae bacterium]|nr:hypothetical protein [Thermoleophilaceae bacterium]
MSHDPLRVLHVGPLDSIHLRRWVAATTELGHLALVGGHLRPGFGTSSWPAPALAQAHHSPQLPWASTRRARSTGSMVDRALAGLPNALIEVPLWARWLDRLVKRLRPDVVHAHYLHQWGAAAALAEARPLIAGALGSDIYLQDRVGRRFADAALARADVVIVPSPHGAAALRSRDLRGSCRHLEAGIDLDFFRPPTEAERVAAREGLELGDGPVVLSFRGGGPVYDLPLAIEAFRRLRARRPAARLVVAHGPMPLDRRNAASLHGLNGSVRVLPAVPPDGMRRLFHAADVGVSVPRSDGSPSSVWESLACSTPVVASDLPQLAQRVGERDGALLVRRDPEAVMEALDRVLADRSHARALGRGGRAWCEANVDRRVTLASLDRLYRGLASAARAREPVTGRA